MARPQKKARVSVSSSSTAKNGAGRKLTPRDVHEPVSDSASSGSSSSSESDHLSLNESESEELVDNSDDNNSEASEAESEEEEPKDDFNNAMDAILGSRVKAHDRENPILLRNKKKSKEIEDAKLEAKAKRLLRQEKLAEKDKARVKNVIPRDPELAGEALQREKRLKSTAQKGVVRLLNAIYSAQNTENDSNVKTKESKEVSKEKFLDMIRSG